MKVLIAILIGIVGLGRIAAAAPSGVDSLQLGSGTNVAVGAGLILLAVFIASTGSKAKSK